MAIYQKIYFDIINTTIERMFAVHKANSFILKRLWLYHLIRWSVGLVGVINCTSRRFVHFHYVTARVRLGWMAGLNRGFRDRRCYLLSLRINPNPQGLHQSRQSPCRYGSELAAHLSTTAAGVGGAVEAAARLLRVDWILNPPSFITELYLF